MQCREPGCVKRSKGPRYHYKCIDHPERLNLRVIRGGLDKSKGKAKARKAA